MAAATSTASKHLPNIKITKPLYFSSSSFTTSVRLQKYVSHACPSLFVFTSSKKQQWSVKSSADQTVSVSVDSAEKWILEPVGNGDCKHIGFKVPLPSAFEITSSMVTVGRVAEKADMVIPVGTVSGLHAQIEKKEGRLLVTDLNSTNGTFVNDSRLKPGLKAIVVPGNFLTFGDMNLAIFRVTKASMEVPSKLEESDNEVELEPTLLPPQ